MSKNYSGEGNVINVTLSGTVAAGDVVVLGSMVGVYLSSGVSGDVVVVALDGVFNLAKVDAAVIAQGEEVTWDASASKFDDNASTPATGDVSRACVAMEAKGATTGESILVKLNVGLGTVA